MRSQCEGIKFPAGVGFYLRGSLYSNNSIINIADIGVGDHALHCITNRQQCCRNYHGGASGNWFLPGQNSGIGGGGESGSTADFSRSRRHIAVLLNRRNNATSPTGLYRCEVLDSGGVLQSLFIGVYGDTGGEHIMDD